MAHNIVQKSNGDTVMQEVQGSRPTATFKRDGSFYPNFANKVQLFDDFLGDALDSKYTVLSGSDAEAVDPAINAAINGTVRLTTGDSNTNVAADASELAHELNWQASNDNLVMEARVKVDAITNLQVFVGFTDSKSLELPFSIGGSNALTSNASDAVGFVFDTGADDDNIFIAGVKGDTDAGPTDTGIAFVADTYITLRVEVGSDENAVFYINGSEVGSLAASVTAATDLTPTIVANSTTTASRNLDVDYLLVHQDR